MYYKRKVYKKLLEWKEKYADNYAVLLEGARRVGKSTIAEFFARNEYKSYILIDFSRASQETRQPSVYLFLSFSVLFSLLWKGDLCVWRTSPRL